MALGKDWKGDLATMIVTHIMAQVKAALGFEPTEARRARAIAEFRNLIDQSCPFKDDVAYEEVRLRPDPDEGGCYVVCHHDPTLECRGRQHFCVAHDAMFDAPESCPKGRGSIRRVAEDVGTAVRLLEDASRRDPNVTWEIARITNTQHAIDPRGAGFGITVTNWSTPDPQHPHRAFEKAGYNRTVTEAAVAALHRVNR